MGDMHDAWFFIGVFVFIFLIWVATGGPLHPIAFTGPSLAQPQELGGGTYLSLPRAPFGIGGSGVSLSGSSSGGSGSNASVPIVTGSVFGDPSPYRSLISLNRFISGANASDPKNESVVVTISQNASVPVNISGWHLVSDATSKSAVIPKGTEIPTSGIVNASQDIVLTAGTRAIIVSGQSPIGASFRENKCIGYFSTFQSFIPSLSQNCPDPDDELAQFYGPNLIRDPKCIDFVHTLSRCQVTLTPPPAASGACQSFVVKYLNYNGCVDAHRNDRDFLDTSWRIYLGRTSAMWRSDHEVVKLLDSNYKTVDAFSY